MPDKNKCPMFDEISVLYSLTISFSPWKYLPSHLKNQILPKVQQLQTYRYEKELAPIEASLEQISKLALQISETLITSSFIGLFFQIFKIINAIKEIHKLIEQIKTFSEQVCNTKKT